MIQSISPDSFSAIVRIELHIAGKCLPVAQAGGGQLIFDKPVSLPKGDGELVMYIDESPQRWRVFLQPESAPVRIVRASFEHIA
ncbi:MAG TPA: hypothetical protein VKJ65_10325 [Phycisphaerae bacterium]|nr:hypothetical protein [Phycisphaerae bacterium]